MAIQYSAGTTYRNDVYASGSLTSASDIVDAIKTSCVAAGMTLNKTINAFVIYNMTVNATDTKTVTLGSKVYTFQAILTNSDGNVLIGATAADTLTNLFHAVTLGTGSGTTYAAATTANSNVTAYAPGTDGGSHGAPASTSILVESLLTGTAGNGAATGTFATNVTSATFSAGASTQAGGGGYWLRTPITAQQQSANIYVFNPVANNNPVCVQVGNYEGDTWSGPHPLILAASPSEVTNLGPMVCQYSASTDYRVIASSQHFWVTKKNAAPAQFSNGGAGTLYIPSFQACHKISQATNATPIVVTTSDTHGYTTGDAVTIKGVNGNTAANGSWTVTVVNTTQFSLDTSVGNGAFVTTGNPRVGKTGPVVRELYDCYWAFGSGSSTPGWRKELHIQGGSYQLLVQATPLASAGASAQTGDPIGVVLVNNNASYNGNELLWFNQTNMVTEPLVGFGTALAGTFFVMGQFWDSVYCMKAITRDLTGTFNSHNWWNWTDNNTGGSTFDYQGSFLLVVP